jgi:hypothetical protein
MSMIRGKMFNKNSNYACGGNENKLQLRPWCSGRNSVKIANFKNAGIRGCNAWKNFEKKQKNLQKILTKVPEGREFVSQTKF